MKIEMIVQYVVGLCCMQAHSDEVRVTLGDYVHDVSSGTRRDVDVTIRSIEKSRRRAFKAFEVKHEHRKLDISRVEQLCAKLNDMPEIDERYIVSSSGYSVGAINKAKSKGVGLLRVVEWNDSFGDHFRALSEDKSLVDFFQDMRSHLLCWSDYSIYFECEGEVSYFEWKYIDKLYARPKTMHSRFSKIRKFVDHILHKSTVKLLGENAGLSITGVLNGEEVSNSVSPDYLRRWQASDVVDVMSESVFIKTPQGLARLSKAYITGTLYWEVEDIPLKYYVLFDEISGAIWSAAAIAQCGPIRRNLYGFTFSGGSRSIGLTMVDVGDHNLNAIRRLVIK